MTEAATDGDWVLDALTRFERPLLRFAASLVGTAQASDVVQDTFLKLCKEERSRLESGVGAWLFKVCKNRSLDLLRRAKPGAELDTDALSAPDSGPLVKLERHQSLSRVQRLVSDLPERERQVVLLKFDAGLSYREIADVMGLSVSNVGFILHTTLKEMRAELASESTPASTRRAAQ